jgi:hypothetical protein
MLARQLAMSEPVATMAALRSKGNPLLSNSSLPGLPNRTFKVTNLVHTPCIKQLPPVSSAFLVAHDVDRFLLDQRGFGVQLIGSDLQLRNLSGTVGFLERHLFLQGSAPMRGDAAHRRPGMR